MSQAANNRPDSLVADVISHAVGSVLGRWDGRFATGERSTSELPERQEAFVSELRDFEDKLRRAANLNLDPDLKDGVVLNIAPIRELVPWKEAKAYWDDLIKGEYEWSSIGKHLRERGLATG